MTREEAQAKAREIGKHMMDSIRESNAAYALETGEPSTVTEEDYLKGEREIAQAAMNYWKKRGTIE